MRGVRGEVRPSRASAVLRAAFVLAWLCCAPTAAGQGTAPEAPPAAAGPAQEGAENLPVARVNGVPVTMGAVVREMARLQSRAPGGGAPAPEALRAAALRRLVLQELAVQRAAALGMSAAPAEVDAELAAFSAAAGGQEKLAAFLVRESLTEEQLRAHLARDLLIRRALERDVAAAAAPGEGELRAAYERRAAAFAVPEKLVVTDVLFFLDPGSAAGRGKAAALQAKLLGEAGGDPAALTPDGTFIVRTLELKEADDPELYAAARRLAPGSVSPVLAAGGSLHVVRLDKYEPARQRPFEEVRPQLERELRGRQEREQLEAWEARLRAGAVIENLEPGAARP